MSSGFTTRRQKCILKYEEKLRGDPPMEHDYYMRQIYRIYQSTKSYTTRKLSFVFVSSQGFITETLDFPIDLRKIIIQFLFKPKDLMCL